MSPRPLLVVVTGMPAAGKTTLARELGARLRFPLVEKDEIKETLFDTVGTGDVEWSQSLGTAAYAVIFLFLDRLLAAGSPAIAEANFFRGDHEPRFAALPPHRSVQIHCHAPIEVLVERYRARPQRHPGHLDDQRVGELLARHESGRNGPLDLAGELIELDTTEPVDVEALAARWTASSRGLRPSDGAPSRE